jgi:hypothetical protein
LARSDDSQELQPPAPVEGGFKDSRHPHGTRIHSRSVQLVRSTTLRPRDARRDELGVPTSCVTVFVGNTVIAPLDQQTRASHSTVLIGNAVPSRCRDIQAMLPAGREGGEPLHGHAARRGATPASSPQLPRSTARSLRSLDLEELARQRIYEFLFVALPVKIRGATGSMVDPVAII